jgi:hypothetical protein
MRKFFSHPRFKLWLMIYRMVTLIVADYLGFITK